MVDLKIWEYIAEALPNVLAVLIGCLISAQYLPRRKHFGLRVALACAFIILWRYAGYVLSDHMPWETGRYVGMITFSGLFLFSAGAVCWWFQATIYQALFAATVSYSLQNMCERIVEIFIENFPWIPRQVIIPLFAFSLICYDRFCKRYVKRQAMFDFSNVDNRVMLLIALGVAGVCIVLDIQLKFLCRNLSQEIRTYIHIMMVLFSFLGIVISMSHLRESDAEVRANEAALLLRNEQRRFESDRQLQKAINLKCHDIRHQIAALGTGGDEGYRAELRKIGKLVDVYDTTPNSKNAALDVVLTDKMLACSSRKIAITCMADGRRLGFMDNCDIYALFANILDNAIEAADQVADPEQRMISLTVDTRDNFLVIEAQNFFVGTLDFDDGLPVTTKADRANHGFGTHSIRMLTEKYDGYLKIGVQDDIFTLSVVLPIPLAA